MKRDHPYSIVVEGDNGVVKGLLNFKCKISKQNTTIGQLFVKQCGWIVWWRYIGSLTWESSGKSVANRVQTIAEVSTNLV